ncbi:G-D-S-L family lipolytic protein [Flavobacteriaceae bacterium Ap0902]|nr:G-D-S-L family lipolytic protein [Flavobacteriaceae bacterium Ap0902]
MKLLYKSIFFAALSLIVGCDDDFENDVDDIVITSGEADFTTYVALGNSLTSGFADGALYRSAQENSYPAILSSRMERAGGGAFTQPLMPDDIGGFANLGLAGKLQLQIVDGSPVPVPTVAESNFSSIAAEGPYNNMGVPGAKSYHLLAPGYGNPAGIEAGLANPYFARFASSANTTVFQDAMAQQPTFFTLWIGNNDVLSYAMSGGVGTNQTGNMDASTYGSNDISDPNLVAGIIQNISQTMVSAGAKGVLGNVPNVTSIPFFTTVPAQPLSPTNTAYSSRIDQLNEFYAGINQIFAALGADDRQIAFSKTVASGIVFIDDSLDDLSAQIAGALIQSGYPATTAQLLGSIFGQARQSREGDLIPLTMSSRIGALDEIRVQDLMQMGVSQEQAGLLSLVGLTYPADEFVLSADEADQVATAIAEINEGIENIAAEYNLAHVDMNAMMRELESGMLFDGVNYTTDFISGGAFSLDGIHLNGRGYAVIANAFLDAINDQYRSNLPLVNPNNYPGTTFP